MIGRDAKSCVSTTNTDTSALEKQIDEMVYALYGLTSEEIAIVEGSKNR